MNISKRQNILIQRIGAKDNDIKSFIDFLPSDRSIIVEPFGGSFAVCRRVYNDDQYKKIVNDLDDNLNYAYNNPKDYADLRNKWADMTQISVEKKEFKKNIFDDSLKYDIKLKNLAYDSLCIRGGLIKKSSTQDFSPQINFIKKITFTNKNYIDILNEYKYNKNAFIFLDPPYLFSNNKTYDPQNGDKTDMTNILIEILNVMNDKKTKSKIMLIINKLDIITYLFKKYIKGEYNKTYNISKKKMVHLIICNY